MDGEPVSVARVGRAVALMTMSLLTIAVGGLAFLHPNISLLPQSSPPHRPLPYHIGAVDFVSPDVGWVAADFETGDYVVLHTIDGGVSWTAQLSASTGGNQQYLKFFDSMAGVFALVDTRPVLNRTSDGGRTWTAIPALGRGSTVLSWSFIDSDHGWMLADPAAGSPPTLYSTEDRGFTWHDLGRPVTDPEEAFGAQFSFLTTGWLASAGLGPYAFKTGDFGGTWRRVRLPVPGWNVSGGGRFFVDVQQTSSSGAIASVVYYPNFMGRGGVVGRIRQFPPLTVPFYDGSSPKYHIVSTMIDQVIGGPNSTVEAPESELLRSVDDGATWVAIEPPALSGTFGYASKSSWWWVDAGAWSSSADGGVTWIRQPGAGLIAPLPGSLHFLDRDHAWFAGATTPALETTSDAGRHWRLVTLPTL
jgi:photosystem II stability/assembly factor-like uncharacterized protein